MWHLPWPVIEQDQWTRVPCIAKQILNHWTTREAPLLNPLMNCQIVFHSSCTILHYLQQCTLFSFSPYLCQHLFSGLSAYNSHPSGSEVVPHPCYLHPLYDVAYLMCLLAIYLLWRKLTVMSSRMLILILRVFLMTGAYWDEWKLSFTPCAFYF